jgi:hypothetical protein
MWFSLAMCYDFHEKEDQEQEGGMLLSFTGAADIL